MGATFTTICEQVRNCDSQEPHCKTLRAYRESVNHPDVRTPLLCDGNSDARIAFIGALGGEITFHEPGEAAYEYIRCSKTDYSLGWQSGLNLAKLLHRVYLRAPSLVRCSIGDLHGPLDPARVHLRDPVAVDSFLRCFFSPQVMAVHRTNLLKCHGPAAYKEGTRGFREAATVCATRHLAHELAALRPAVVVPLGNPATQFFVSWVGLPRPSDVRGWLGLPREQRRVVLPAVDVETIVNPFFHPSPLGWANSSDVDRDTFVRDIVWALGAEAQPKTLRRRPGA